MASSRPPDKEAPLTVAGSVFLDRGGRGLAGRGRIRLLERIEALGSISRAAAELGMSYRSAWEAIEAMDNVAGEPLVQRAPGGRGGGGTRLTDAGRSLIRTYREAEAAYAALTAQLAGKVGDPARALEIARAIGFRSSARNQLRARVASIPSGEGVTIVVLDLGDGHALHTAVTRDAIDALALDNGAEVLALVKASAVAVRAPARAAPAGPVDVLRGVVRDRRDAGAVPQFRVAVSARLTLWGIGEPSTPLAAGDEAECVIPWSAPMLVLPQA